MVNIKVTVVLGHIKLRDNSVSTQVLGVFDNMQDREKAQTAFKIGHVTSTERIWFSAAEMEVNELYCG